MTLTFVAFLVLIVALLALDLGLLHRKAHVIDLREAIRWSAVWISVGLAFSGLIWLLYAHGWGVDPEHAEKGPGAATLQYLTGYVIEKSLSVDNLFVMSVIFGAYRIPAQVQHRVLFWGIVGALFLRGGMILGGVWLVNHFTWLFYVFGGYLALTGIKLALAGHGDLANAGEHSGLVQWMQRHLPVAQGDHGTRFFVRENGALKVTTPFLALVSIEWADVVFALDSVPAVLAISTDNFIVLTSNVFAILGLRALYFVLASVLSRFCYLKPALAIILLFIGAKLMLYQVFHIPTALSLMVVLGVLSAAIWLSVRRDRLLRMSM